MIRCWWFVVCAGLVFLPSYQLQAQEQQELMVDGRYSISKTGGFSPYVSVMYTLRVRAGIGTLGVSKVLPGSYGQEERLAIVQSEALKELLEALQVCDQVQTVTPERFKPRSVSSVWTFGVERGESRKKIQVADPERQKDRLAQRCLETMRVAVERHVGKVPFRDVFFAKGEFGYLQVSSDPVARVVLDGVDTGQESPLIGIPMSVGEHEVEFIDEARGVHRRYKVTIMSDITTNLSVDLR